jgi:hypothetical protein
MERLVFVLVGEDVQEPQRMGWAAIPVLVGLDFKNDSPRIARKSEQRASAAGGRPAFAAPIALPESRLVLEDWKGRSRLTRKFESPVLAHGESPRQVVAAV